MSTYLIKKGFTMPNYWVESTPNVWKNTLFGVEKGLFHNDNASAQTSPSAKSLATNH